MRQCDPAAIFFCQCSSHWLSWHSTCQPYLQLVWCEDSRIYSGGTDWKTALCNCNFGSSQCLSNPTGLDWVIRRSVIILKCNEHLILFCDKYRNSAKRYWTSLFNVVCAKLFLTTNMSIATEEIFSISVIFIIKSYTCTKYNMVKK